MKLCRLPVVVLLVAASAAARGGALTKAPAKGGFPHLRLDLKSKTIEMDGTFCLGDCPLELLVCQGFGRDYESLVSSPARPSHLHTCLLALGLKPNSAARLRITSASVGPSTNSMAR